MENNVDKTGLLPRIDFEEHPRSCWQTPKVLLDVLRAEFKFTIDAAADASNTICERFYTREMNAVISPLPGPGEIVFLNPPYCGAKYDEYDLKVWEEYAARLALAGNTIVCVFPSDTSVEWYLSASQRADEIRCIIPRIGFDPKPGADIKLSGNRGGTMIIVYRPGLATGPKGANQHEWDLRAHVTSAKLAAKAERKEHLLWMRS